MKNKEKRGKPQSPSRYYFRLASDWVNRWLDFSRPITVRNEAKPIQSRITFVILSLLCYRVHFFYFIIFFQDSPDQGALHLVRGLLNVVQEYTWEINSGAKMSIYLNAVCLLSAMSQVGLCVIVSVWSFEFTWSSRAYTRVSRDLFVKGFYSFFLANIHS